MKLETQIAKLEEIGLRLNEDLSVDDLLAQFDREQYESDPFGVLLFIFGAEIEGELGTETHCRQVWSFDTECIEDNGAYVAIAKHLCALTGRQDALHNITDLVDVEGGKAWIEYTADGVRRHWDAEINDDWVDASVMARIMEDLEKDERRFYSIDSGQSAVLLYLDPLTVTKLNQLIGGAAKPALGASPPQNGASDAKKPAHRWKFWRH